jgi:hypothetical protein
LKARFAYIGICSAHQADEADRDYGLGQLAPVKTSSFLNRELSFAEKGTDLSSLNDRFWQLDSCSHRKLGYIGFALTLVDSQPLQWQQPTQSFSSAFYTAAYSRICDG